MPVFAYITTSNPPPFSYRYGHRHGEGCSSRGRSRQTIVVTPDGQDAYLADRSDGRYIATYIVPAVISLPSSRSGLAVLVWTRFQTRACFLHLQPASVSVIDMAINPAVSTVPEGETPSSVATTPAEKGAHDTFSTEGRQLLDSAGNKVILRGVNKMSVWDNEDPTGEISFAEIRKTGANSVRIVWLHTLNGASTDTATLDALITNARANHLIPVIELHDATGDWSGLQAL